MGCLFDLLFSVVVAAILYPIGSIGKSARAALTGKYAEEPARARRWTLLGIAMVLAALVAAYLLFGTTALLVAAAAALVIIVLGWFGIFVEPGDVQA